MEILDEHVGWLRFNKAMNDKHEENIIQIKGVLELLEECEKILFGIIKTEIEYPNKSIIHDEVLVPVLARSFRHCVAALKISLSGYPDSAYIIIRTLWECWIRILILKDEPIEAAFGFRLNEINEHKKIYEYYSKDYADYLNELGEMKSGLEREIESADLTSSSKERVKALGNQLNYQQECDRIDAKHNSGHFRNEYKKSYRDFCMITHGKRGPDDLFIYESGDVRLVNIDPIPRMHIRAIKNTLDLMTLILLSGAAIVEVDGKQADGLCQQCISIRERMHQYFHDYQ
ncbi:MAG TPA: DUF5677 domain-containing protein [bacterium]|nr:DUF5677 domain-containing protein [bacterium]